MPSTAASSASHAKTGRSPRASKTDAVALLRADHKKVSDLFEQFEKARSPQKKKALVNEICMELTIHTQIEEEIFYPGIQDALQDRGLVPEARVEHQSIKDLIAAVQGFEPDGEDYDAKVKVMGEWVEHHVKEEQKEMFPQAKKAKVDLARLGERMLARKQELTEDPSLRH